MGVPRIRLSQSEYNVITEQRKRKEEFTIALGCVHMPFQNRTLMEGVKKLASDIRIERLVWLGDALDCNALGDYERGKLSSTGITLEEEYEEGRKELDEWDSILKDSAIRVYMFGNHESRYYRWQKSPDNAKYGELLSPIKGLRLDERNYTVITDYRDGVYHIGDLELYHGDLTNIHVAKKSLDTFRKNTMFAHTHRIQVYREGEYASYNIGTMANLNAPAFGYAPRSMKEKWANGFAVIVTIDGHSHVEVIQPRDNHFYYGGRRY
jgi:hypothetical protein